MVLNAALAVQVNTPSGPWIAGSRVTITWNPDVGNQTLPKTGNVQIYLMVYIVHKIYLLTNSFFK